MIAPRIRPRFEIGTSASPSVVLERISLGIAGEDTRCEGAVEGRHIHLNICREERKIWSPHLNLDVAGSIRGSTISGHFGPRTDIWTLIVALYVVSSFSAVMSILFAISQLLLGFQPTALWVVLVAGVFGVVVYALAWVGQRLSESQMDIMKTFVVDAVGPETIVS